MKLNFDFEKIKLYLKKASHVLLIILCLVSGYVIGYFYKEVKYQMSDKNQFKHIYRMSESSIAINEKSQLVIFNKTDGSYRIYEDTVGTKIFTMYADRLKDLVKPQNEISK